MRVLITGANGVLGLSSIRALRADGHDVVAMVRSAAAGEVVGDLGAEPVPGSVHDADALLAAMQGCDAVANLATRIPIGAGALRPGSLKAVDRIRLYGSRTVAQAARASGVRRLVQQSLSFIYADAGDAWIDERSPVDVTRATEPLVVAEENAQAFGGETVSLRFGLLTGDDRNTAWLMGRAARGRSIGLGSGDSWMHVVHTDDVGTAVAAALTVPPGTYNVGAEPVRRRDYADVIAAAAGRREAHFLPPWVLRAGGEKLEILVRSQRVTSRRFQEASGWTPSRPVLDSSWLDGLLAHA